MAKRIADKELTDRNWDQEEDGEEVRPHYHQQLVEGDVCSRSPVATERTGCDVALLERSETVGEEGQAVIVCHVITRRGRSQWPVRTC